MLSRLDQYEEGYPHVSNFALLMFCGYVITWYLQIGYRIPVLGAIRFEFVYAAVLTVVAMLFTPKPKLDCPVIKWVILLYLAMIIQIPFSYNVEHSWTIFIDRVVKFSFMAFFIVRFVQSPKGLILFIGAFLLACFKMGQEGFVGQITGNMVWQNQGVMRLHGSTPLYAHPNSFAGMAIGTLPFIVCLFKSAKTSFKMILATMFYLSFFVIIFSGSRTAYLGVVFLFFWFFVKNKKIATIIIVCLVLLVSSGAFVESQYYGRFLTIFSGVDKEGSSIEKRKEILSDALDVLVIHPFGVGIAAFPTVRQSMFGRIQDTHNLYLEVLTNLGVQGFVVFLGFLVSIVSSLRKTSKKIALLIDSLGWQGKEEDFGKNNSDDQSVLCLKIIQSISTAVLVFLLIRIVLGMFGMDFYEIYWWFSLGLVVAIHNMVNIKMEEMQNKKKGVS